MQKKPTSPNEEHAEDDMASRISRVARIAESAHVNIEATRNTICVGVSRDPTLGVQLAHEQLILKITELLQKLAEVRSAAAEYLGEHYLYEKITTAPVVCEEKK